MRVGNMKTYVKSSYNLDPTGEISEAWEILENAGISEETLNIVTSINGYSVEALNAIARAAFGVDLDDLTIPVEESTKIESAKSAQVSLEAYVDEPFDLNDDEVQYKIAEWAVNRLMSKLKKKKSVKGRELYIDDLSWGPKKIFFEIYEEDNNGGRFFDEFSARLSFYDGPADDYYEVESLIDDDIQDFLLNY